MSKRSCAKSSCSRRTLCGDPACRSAVAVAPCKFVLSSANPLRRSRVSKRSRCGAVRMRLALDEPSAEMLRVEALSLWRRSIFLCICLRSGVGSCLVVRASAFTIALCLGFTCLVRGSSGLKIATFSCESSTRRAKKELLAAIWKDSKSSTQSALAQLRGEIRKLLPQLRLRLWKCSSRTTFVL